MRVVLNITEKPSIAKHLSQALSWEHQMTNGRSKSQYNPVYLIDRTFLDQPAQVIISSVTGHLTNMSFQNNYPSWTSVDPVEFLQIQQIQQVISDDKKQIKENLLEFSWNATDLFLWLDCDREGEAIAYEVIGVCTQYNKRLKIHWAQFSSVSHQELIHAFENPIVPNPNLNKAVLIWQEMDLRSGAALTRIQTVAIQDNYGKECYQNFISYGPCQIPTLALVVNWFLESFHFQPETFYYISPEVMKDNAKIQFNWERGNFFDKYFASTLYEYIMQDPWGFIKSIEGKKVTKFKPLPLTTVEFQKQVVKSLKVSSDKVMAIAEKLYQSGYISYPRTETNTFGNRTDFKGILDKLKNNGNYWDYLESLVFQRPRGGNKNDEAHPPIHPVKQYDGDPNSLEAKIFDFIARRFIACCSKDAILDEQNIILEICGEKFITQGQQVVEANFLEIYAPYQKISEKVLPAFRKDEQVDLSELILKEGRTTAPSLLTEPDLISQMDKNQIGTDATIHEHIKTVQERSYVQKVDQVFKPTQLGLALVGAYQKIGLTLQDIKLRAENEKILTSVAEGQFDSHQALSMFQNFVVQNYIKLQDNIIDFLKEFRHIYNKYSMLNHQEIKFLMDPKRPVFGQGTNHQFQNQYQQSITQFEPQRPRLSNHNPSNNSVQIKCFSCNREILEQKISMKGQLYLRCLNPSCQTNYFFNGSNIITNINATNNYCQNCNEQKLEIITQGQNISVCYINTSCPSHILSHFTAKVYEQRNNSYGKQQPATGNYRPQSIEWKKSQKGNWKKICKICSKEGHTKKECFLNKNKKK